MDSPPVILINDAPSCSFSLKELVEYKVQVEFTKNFALKKKIAGSHVSQAVPKCGMYVVEDSYELLILKIPLPQQ